MRLTLNLAVVLIVLIVVLLILSHVVHALNMLFYNKLFLHVSLTHYTFCLCLKIMLLSLGYCFKIRYTYMLILFQKYLIAFILASHCKELPLKLAWLLSWDYCKVSGVAWVVPVQVSDFQLAPVVSVRTRALVVVLTRVDNTLPPLMWPAEQLAVLHTASAYALAHWQHRHQVKVRCEFIWECWVRCKFMCSWGSNRQWVWVWAQGKEKWDMLGKMQVDTEWSRLVVLSNWVKYLLQKWTE